MSNSNSPVGVYVTARSDLAAYDQLDPSLRLVLQNTAIDVAAPSVRRRIRKGASVAQLIKRYSSPRYAPGGIMGERIPLDPADEEWLGRAKRAAGRLLDGETHDGRPR